jgi:chaperonin cofactor prefoldin
MKNLVNLPTILLLTTTLILLFQISIYKTHQNNSQHLQAQVDDLQTRLTISSSTNKKLQQQLTKIEKKLAPKYYHLAQNN